MYGIRKDIPEGWLRCDGNEYPASVFQNFITQYIITEKIPSIILTQYEEEKTCSIPIVCLCEQ
jgi:hypothetical protein